jgi:uncharacterized SAM-binding protein YcdF (DUF218 family)
MFFILSKTLDTLIEPLTWSLLGFVIALLLVRRRPRLSAFAGVLALLVLVVFSEDVVANALWGSLERGVRSTMKPNVTYDAVIVLSGMVEPDPTEARGEPSYNDNVERVLTAFDLLRVGRVQNVLVSGGATRTNGTGPIEADVLAKQLAGWGIDGARIVEERQSRNTRENATESAKLVAEKGWKSLLLVTSAFHMPRALGCFRRTGLQVDVLPVDYRASHRSAWFPRAGALNISTKALHEWVGRLVYRVVGYAR